MAIKTPERNYLTFTELAIRWKCTEQDIQHLIIKAELKPSYFIGADVIYREPHFQSNGAVQLIEVDESMRWCCAGFFYLHDPEQIAHSDCKFNRFSRLQFAPPLNEAKNGELYFFDTSMALAEVLRDGVVMMEELAFIEKKLAAPIESLPIEKPLITTERNTLLTIIAALANAARISLDDYSKPGKAAGFIEGLTAELGARVSKRAIEDHLKKIPDALESRMK